MKKQVSWGEISLCKSHEEESQQGTSFTGKNEHAKSYMNKNSTRNKISFTKGKINVQVSQRDKSTWEKLQTKISTHQVPRM